MARTWCHPPEVNAMDGCWWWKKETDGAWPCVCVCVCMCMYLYARFSITSHTHTHTHSRCVALVAVVCVCVCAAATVPGRDELVAWCWARLVALAARQAIEHGVSAWRSSSHQNNEQKQPAAAMARTTTHTHTHAWSMVLGAWPRWPRRRCGGRRRRPSWRRPASSSLFFLAASGPMVQQQVDMSVCMGHSVGAALGEGIARWCPGHFGAPSLSLATSSLASLAARAPQQDGAAVWVERARGGCSSGGRGHENSLTVTR